MFKVKFPMEKYNKLKTKDEKLAFTCGYCGCYLLVLLVNVTLGALATNYDVWVCTGKSLPVWASVLLGLFFAQLAIPVAIVFWILVTCAVIVPPLFGG